MRLRRRRVLGGLALGGLATAARAAGGGAAPGAAPAAAPATGGRTPSAGRDAGAAPAPAGPAAGSGQPPDVAAGHDAAPPVAAPAPAPPAGPHGRVRLRPDDEAMEFTLAPAGGDSRLLVTGMPPLPLPGRPVAARTLPLARRQVLACDTALPDGEVLAFLVGADATGPLLLAVECRERREAGRRQLSLRLEAVPDDRRLLLRYEAQDGARHEGWTDALAWDRDALRSEPLRPVLAGTMQARMAAVRARVLALLARSRRGVTLEALRPTGVLDPMGWVDGT